MSLCTRYLIFLELSSGGKQHKSPKLCYVLISELCGLIKERGINTEDGFRSLSRRIVLDYPTDPRWSQESEWKGKLAKDFAG